AKLGALPGGALENARQYALTIWPRLTRFLEHPEVELSNNLIENSMRPIALGRKNWIHIWSPEAGSKVAAILSVIETCRRLKISARDYLSSLLPGLASMRLHRLAALTQLGPLNIGSRQSSHTSTRQPVLALTLTVNAAERMILGWPHFAHDLPAE